MIDDNSIKELLKNHTIDEVIMHVLKLARKQADGTLSESEAEETEINFNDFQATHDDDDDDDADNPEAIDNDTDQGSNSME